MLGIFCKKKPFDLNIYLSHMKYGRKISIRFAMITRNNVTGMNSNAISEQSEHELDIGLYKESPSMNQSTDKKPNPRPGK